MQPASAGRTAAVRDQPIRWLAIMATGLQVADMASVPPMTPESARSSLQELTSAREHIANRITSPWWYRVGTGLCMAFGFVGMSLIMGNSGPGIPDGDSYPAGTC